MILIYYVDTHLDIAVLLGFTGNFTAVNSKQEILTPVS